MDKTDLHHKKPIISGARIMRGIILITAVFLLVFGISKGGHTDVRNKAVRICYECIGIG